ncbi:hypothetical protein BDY21DRAFT_96216 [Lineolata rhizophorae]|uniref:Uncharacterized protein n=1 Tax=Lineolata rhizophorae TaxID=578093 RepID=A0A6A6NT24_9PEZI|nr:hypothetical protein BDY21DRAFT_96216 [Lineolata rhizophorae]
MSYAYIFCFNNFVTDSKVCISKRFVGWCPSMKSKSRDKISRRGSFQRGVTAICYTCSHSTLPLLQSQRDIMKSLSKPTNPSTSNTLTNTPYLCSTPGSLHMSADNYTPGNHTKEEKFLHVLSRSTPISHTTKRHREEGFLAREISFSGAESQIATGNAAR